jgi:hypothetical protein
MLSAWASNSIWSGIDWFITEWGKAFYHLGFVEADYSISDSKA